MQIYSNWYSVKSLVRLYIFVRLESEQTQKTKTDHLCHLLISLHETTVLIKYQ